jgi:hypothetical protein
MTAREYWKLRWRMIRIARRETSKATADMVVYGTSIVRVSLDGLAEHIPIQQWRYATDASPDTRFFVDGAPMGGNGPRS